MADLEEEELEGFEEEPKEERSRRRFVWPLLLGLALVVVLAGVGYDAWRKATDGKGPSVPIEVSGRPSLKLERDVVDLGDVQMGKRAEAVVQVANVGDQALTFGPEPYTQVLKGCCAPNPTLGATALYPGETTNLTLSFTMQSVGGPHEFRLHVQTNDPQQPDKTIQVLSNWVP